MTLLSRSIGIICIADNLWHHLRRLGLHENDENHEHFGNLKQALESLVSQRFEFSLKRS